MGHPKVAVFRTSFQALIPGENVAWIDTLDNTPQKVTATDAHQTHTRAGNREKSFQMPQKL
ncbi:MAG TPA: hypothetical protein VE133_15675 [Candidatus Sulfotelmatobacter sp.]|nr:hypothetical protein [Candidatus Sulfotelmatobacter sp.]